MIEFDKFWRDKVHPLQGKTINTLDQNIENKILSVTPEYLERKSTKNEHSRKQKIKKEVFEEIFDLLKKEGILTRIQINKRYKGWRSSVITSILAKNEDHIKYTTKPLTLYWKR